MTNMFVCQCCILMYKIPPLMINNHEDTKLLVEFVIDTLGMQEMEITASIQKFILRIYRRLHSIIKIFPY